MLHARRLAPGGVWRADHATFPGVASVGIDIPTMPETGLDYLVHAPWPWDEMGKDCLEEDKKI
jgi:hypothetical protein